MSLKVLEKMHERQSSNTESQSSNKKKKNGENPSEVQKLWTDKFGVFK